MEEGRLVKNEIIGFSDGSKNQRFTLAHAGLILRSAGATQKINRDIIITTSLGETIDEWTLQESLAFSREKQKDYTVEIDDQDAATVIFGDGAFGAIPGGRRDHPGHLPGGRRSQGQYPVSHHPDHCRRRAAGVKRHQGRPTRRPPPAARNGRASSMRSCTPRPCSAP